MDTPARHLIFHGAIVLSLGLAFGAPYARAIKRNAPAHVVHSWRVAHLSIPIGATLMLAVAAVMSALAVSLPVKWALATLLIVSSYAFCLSLPVAALTGNRGLSSSETGWGRFVYAGNMTGAWTSMAAALVLVAASFQSL